MHDPKAIVLCSAISEVFLRRLVKQDYIKYVEGSDIIDAKQDLIEMGDPDGGGLKDMDEKLTAYVAAPPLHCLVVSRQLTFCSRVENLKDLVLYRFGSTGVVQVLSRAAEILGLVPVFPVRNIHTFVSGTGGSNAVFRDCVLVKK